MGRIIAGFVFTSLLIVALWRSFAGTSPAPAMPGGTIEPEVTGIGERMSIGDERFIAIHRQSRNQNVGPVVHYFHKPLFILQTNPTPIAGYPNIVAVGPRVIDKKAFLTFKVILTTQEFQEKARAFVIANDPDLKTPGSQVDLNSIRVNGWPIVTLSVKVIEPLSGDVLGSWISPSLEAAGPTIHVPIAFDDRSLQVFKDLAPTGSIQSLGVRFPEACFACLEPLLSHV